MGPRQLSGPHFAIRVVERSDDPERSSTSVGWARAAAWRQHRVVQ